MNIRVNENIQCGATFSNCRKWRYTLYRTWDKFKPVCMFIGLNPSTADEFVNDPTINRCMLFAQRWGYGQLIMTNIFSFRATDPRIMKQCPDPIGPDNDYWLKYSAIMTSVKKFPGEGIIVAAWGSYGSYMDRGDSVYNLIIEIGKIYILGKTKKDHPRHPLYLKNDIVPYEWL